MSTLLGAARAASPVSVVVHFSDSHAACEDDEQFGSSDAFSAGLAPLEAAAIASTEEEMRQMQEAAEAAAEHDEHDDSGDLCDDAEDTPVNTAVPKLSFAALLEPASDSVQRRCSMPSAIPVAASSTVSATGVAPTGMKKIGGAAARVAKKTASKPTGSTSTTTATASKKGIPGLAQGARPAREQCKSVYAAATSKGLTNSTSSASLNRVAAPTASTLAKGDQSHSQVAQQPQTARGIAKERAGIAIHSQSAGPSECQSARGTGGKENAAATAAALQEARRCSVMLTSRYMKMGSSAASGNTASVTKIIPAAAPAAAPTATASATSSTAASGAMTARRASLTEMGVSMHVRSASSSSLQQQQQQQQQQAGGKRRSAAMAHSMEYVTNSGTNPAGADAADDAASSPSLGSPAKKARFSDEVCASPATRTAMDTTPTDAPIQPGLLETMASANAHAMMKISELEARLRQLEAAHAARLCEVEEAHQQQLAAKDDAIASLEAESSSAQSIMESAQKSAAFYRSQYEQEEAKVAEEKVRTLQLQTALGRINTEKHQAVDRADKLAAELKAMKKAAAARGEAGHTATATATVTAAADEWQSGSSVNFGVGSTGVTADGRRATLMNHSIARK